MNKCSHCDWPIGDDDVCENCGRDKNTTYEVDADVENVLEMVYCLWSGDTPNDAHWASYTRACERFGVNYGE
jgi:hypothetical protein